MSWDRNKPNKFRASVILIAGLILICIAATSITLTLITRGAYWGHDGAGHGHLWLHKELNLDKGEAAAIDALEPRYRRNRAELKSQFEAKIDQLRKQITRSDEFTEEVRQTIHELHLIHGQLQELSIRHYYDMMQALTVEKQAKLKELAGEALSIPE